MLIFIKTGHVIKIDEYQALILFTIRFGGRNGNSSRKRNSIFCVASHDAKLTDSPCTERCVYGSRVHIYAHILRIYTRGPCQHEYITGVCRLGHGHLGTFLHSHSGTHTHGPRYAYAYIRSRGGLRNGGAAVQLRASRVDCNATAR